MADRFTAEKFQWLEQITFDKHAEGRGDAVRVGFAISTFINRKTGEAWPGLDHLAGVLGANEKTVRRGIDWLVDRGHMETKRGGKGHPTRYTLKLHDRTELSDQESELVDSSVPLSGQNCPDDRTELSDLGGQKCPTNPLTEQFEETSEEHSEDSTSEKRRSKKQLEEEFQEFWNAYPNKKSMGIARQAFLKARKVTAHLTIMAGAMRYAAERTNQNSKYTSYPAKWLEAEGWNDQSPPDDGKTSVQRALDEVRFEVSGSNNDRRSDLEAFLSQDFSNTKPWVLEQEKEIGRDAWYPHLFTQFEADQSVLQAFDQLDGLQKRRASARLALHGADNARAYILEEAAKGMAA